MLHVSSLEGRRLHGPNGIRASSEANGDSGRTATMCVMPAPVSPGGVRVTALVRLLRGPNLIGRGLELLNEVVDGPRPERLVCGIVVALSQYQRGR